MQLEVGGTDLLVLRQEVNVLKAGLEGAEADYWNFRLNNILAAIAAAEPFGSKGHVSIG
jgi:hypothetical protein